MAWQPLIVFLWITVSGCALHHPRQIAEEELSLFGFSPESACYTATSTVLNSIPFSCHSALGQLLRGSNAPPLSVAQLRLDLLDSELCQTYCSYPLRQAAQDCHTLQLLHNTISAACHANRNGTMCSNFQSSLDVLWEDCNVTMTTNCTEQCYATVQGVGGVMGCCLATLLAVSENNTPCSLPQTQPCSKATPTLPLSALPLIVSTVVALIMAHLHELPSTVSGRIVY